MTTALMANAHCGAGLERKRCEMVTMKEMPWHALSAETHKII